MPLDNYSEQNHLFNMREGLFQDFPPAHSNFIEEPMSGLLNNLMKAGAEYTGFPQLSRMHLKAMLGIMLEYYSLHVAGFSKIKSMEVLTEVFN